MVYLHGTGLRQPLSGEASSVGYARRTSGWIAPKQTHAKMAVRSFDLRIGVISPFSITAEEGLPSW